MHDKWQSLVLGADLLCIGAAAAVAGWLQEGSVLGTTAAFQWIYLLAALVIWSVLSQSRRLDGFHGGWHVPRICAQVVVGVSFLMCSLYGLMLMIRHPWTARVVLMQALVLLVGFIGIRCLIRWFLVSRSYVRSKRRVIILGSGNIVRELALRISRRPETTMEIAGVLSPSLAGPASSNVQSPPGAMSVRSLNILSLMREKDVRELIVVEPLPPGLETTKLISNCRNAGILVHLVPQRYELYLSRAKLIEIEGIPLVSLEQQSLPALGLCLKRASDLVGAALLFVLTAPLLMILAGVLYANKQKSFKKELRCGRNGRPFWMYRLDVDRDAMALHWFERILLQFSLTELPQFWNVLIGDMSLVGPRPESLDRVKSYSEWQCRRLSMRPGLTGLAQVHGLREQHSSEEKARFDLDYIFQWSLFLDMSLLLHTIWIFFKRIVEPDSFRAHSVSGLLRVAPKPHGRLMPNP